jgi:6-pyruvoyltetrahydropterin/6-carboxytetrahydropterin synthase
VHRLFVGQEHHKFSIAHMTVFPDGSKERLHGHNFHVRISIVLKQVGFEHFLDLGILKRALEAQCKEWNEAFLLGDKCPRLEIVRHDDAEIEFRLCGKRYVMPSEDVIVLPVDNVVVENLTVEFGKRWVERVGTALVAEKIASIEVDIRELPGQGGSWTFTP